MERDVGGVGAALRGVELRLWGGVRGEKGGGSPKGGIGVNGDGSPDGGTMGA